MRLVVTGERGMAVSPPSMGLGPHLMNTDLKIMGTDQRSGRQKDMLTAYPAEIPKVKPLPQGSSLHPQIRFSVSSPLCYNKRGTGASGYKLFEKHRWLMKGYQLVPAALPASPHHYLKFSALKFNQCSRLVKIWRYCCETNRGYFK